MVLTLLAPDFRTIVNAALPRHAHCRHMHDAVHVLETLRTQVWAGLVIDPRVMSEGSLMAIVRYASDTGRRVLILTAIDMHNALTILRAFESENVDLLLWSDPLDRTLLSARLRSLQSPSCSSQVVRGLAPQLARLPTRLTACAIAAFGSLPIPRSVESFADEAGMMERTIERAFKKVGLAGPGSLLRAARVATAWDVIRLSGAARPVPLTALRTGFRSTKHFRETVSRLLSMPPTRLAETEPSGDHIAIIIQYLQGYGQPAARGN